MTELVVAKHKTERSTSENAPECRGAYPALFQMRTKRANGALLKSPRRDVTLLFPKLAADPRQCANYAFLWKHIAEAATKAWRSWPDGAFLPIQDGDIPYKPKAPQPGQAPAPVDPTKYAWRHGHWIIEAANYLDPGPRVCVVQNGQIVELPAQTVNGQRMFKSGDYCIPHICAYTFHNETFGCKFSLDGILWTKPGDQIGADSGPKAASVMFGGIAPMGAGVPNASHPNAPGASGGPPPMGMPAIPGVAAPSAPAAAPPAPALPGIPGIPPGAAPGLPAFPPPR